MKISEVIAKLQDAQKLVGDREVSMLAEEFYTDIVSVGVRNGANAMEVVLTSYDIEDVNSLQKFPSSPP